MQNPFQFFEIPTIEWAALFPLIIMAVTGMLTLILMMVRPKSDNGLLVATSLGGLALTALAILQGVGQAPYETAGDMIVHDGFGTMMKLIIVGGTAISILFSEPYLKQKGIAFGEFYTLVIWAAFGGLVMASTRNMLMLFLGLEVLSVALYVLAGMSRSEEKSEESALKYFLLGAFASGFLLYGMAFTYGATGSLHLQAVQAAWLAGDSTHRAMLGFGLSLALIGLSFKASFVPFHQWTPDVYQGSPTNVSGFMAAASKVAAFAMLWRFLEGFAPMKEYWIPALGVLAALTMTVGNLLALQQKDVKRLLGYSSIAHAGYILVGVLAYFQDPTQVNIGTVGFYLISYTLMTLGAFAVVTLLAKRGRETTQLSDLNGLYQRHPLAAVSLVIFVASLIGVPPFAGFFGKLLIFNDALNSGLTWLAVLLAVNSVLSLAYYLELAKSAFVNDPAAGESRTSPTTLSLAATCLVCAVGVVAVSVFFSPIMRFLTQG